VKLRPWQWSDGTPFGWAHWCPGCEEYHSFAVNRPQVNGAQWTFDGNMDKPTFNPSMLVHTYEHDGTTVKDVCHYFLHEGQLKFLGDCTHALKGQTVPLPEDPN